MIFYLALALMLTVTTYYVNKKKAFSNLKLLPRHVVFAISSISVGVAFLILTQPHAIILFIPATLLLWSVVLFAAAYAPKLKFKMPGLMPLPWPPRQPADWGRKTQEQHWYAMFHHNAQLGDHFPNAPGAGPPPTMPLIPLWETHYAAAQLASRLQIRWAQTDTGDWLRIIFGNRMRPPPNGQPLPVCQMMQAKHDGTWIFVELPNDNRFEWQKGPQRVEEVEYTDHKGRRRIALRPCGHPAYQQPPTLDADPDTHGTSKPMSDEELTAMGAAPFHHDNAYPGGGLASSGTVGAAGSPDVSPHPFGSSAPMSDDDLSAMGSAPPHHRPENPDPTDPTTYAGIL